jgi:AcrR family transcriptional regulator
MHLSKPEKMPMKDRILATADRLFYQQGIRAIGVDTIAAEAGISKRTLYNHFPSKDVLIAAYLERRIAMLPSASQRPPLQQILRTFDKLERSFSGENFRGCPFINAVTELGDSDPEVKGIALGYKEARRAWFRERLQALNARNPNELAMQLSILLDGAIAAHLVRDDPTMARIAKNAATVLLRNAGINFDDGATVDVNQK